MFASNALPLPSTFGHEHRPLRLTSETARPQPQGGCHFKSGQQQRCPCQTYQHNRSAPGNICDCGHSACYHSQQNNGGRLSPDRVVSALAEKVKKLEDLVIKERESRNCQISRERQIWEREVRMLREALAPVYHTEADLKRRLTELEDKVDRTYDERSHLKARLDAIDDASMTLERRIDDCNSTRCRKRKASPGKEENGVMSPESNYTCSESSVSDITPITTRKSLQAPSPMNTPLPASIVATSPRSSGVLRLNSSTRYNERHSAYVAQHGRQLPSAVHEPRSSGFLSIDLVERLRDRKVELPPLSQPVSPPNNKVPAGTACTNKTSLPSPPYHNSLSGTLPISGLLSNGIKSDFGGQPHKKLKHHRDRLTGLELLANVASPLAQQA